MYNVRTHKKLYPNPFFFFKKINGLKKETQNFASLLCVKHFFISSVAHLAEELDADEADFLLGKVVA